MAVDTDERNKDYVDSMKELQDKERQRHGGDEGADPLSPGEQAALDQMEAGLRNGDEAPEPDRGGGKNRAETDNASGEPKIPYNPENKRSGGRGWLSRHKKQVGIGGGIGGLLIGGGFGLMTLLHGPLQLIHKAQLLSGFHFTSHETFSDDRSAKFFLYALSGKAAKGRLGAISNKVADRTEARLLNKSGLRSVYHPTTGRLMGYQVVDPDKAKPFISEIEGDGITRSGSIAGTSNPTDINGNPLSGLTNSPADFVDLSDDRFKGRRSITRAATRATGLNRVTSKLSSRLLIKRGGVNFHPLRNVVRSKTDNYFSWRENQRKKKALEHSTGDTADLLDDSPFDPDLDPNAPPGSLRSRSLTKMRQITNTAKGPLIAAAVTCSLKEFSSSIDAQNYENMQKTIRLGMAAVTIGSQVKSNQDISQDILSAVNESNYDPETGTSWTADAGIKTENGEPGGVDYNADAKPGSKEKPVIFRFADGIPNPGVPGTGINVCNSIDVAGNVISSVPGISQAQSVVNSAINSGLGVFGIPSTDRLMEMAIDYFATGGVDVMSRGAKRGGLENIGVRLAANDTFLAMGAKELSETETIEAKASTNAELAYRQSQLGFADRYLDVHNAHSAVASIMRNVTVNVQGNVQFFTKIPSLLFSSITGLFSNRALAAATYDYGFPLFGFSEEEMNNPAVQDPFANAEYIESPGVLENLNAEYGDDCFGMTVSTSGQLVYGQSVDFTKIPDKCRGNGEALLRYRFYLADMVNAHSIACYEGADEQSCAQLGFGGGGGGGNITGSLLPCQGQPRTPPVLGSNSDIRIDWSGIPATGSAGTGSDGRPINYYIREACDPANAKTILIVSSIHGTENGGQNVGFELLFNASLPNDVRVVVVPELNGCGIAKCSGSGRVNKNGVNLNRNFPYNWGGGESSSTNPSSGDYIGPSAGSEPETQAMQSFVTNILGGEDIALSIHYHDNINYVVASSENEQAKKAAAVYSNVMGNMPNRGGQQNGFVVTQAGSFDGWQAATFKKPVLLVEMWGENEGQVIDQAYLQKNVDAVLAVLSQGGNLGLW